MDARDPFGYPVTQYLWVVGLASVGGLIKHLNSVKKIQGGKLLIDVITSGFSGIMTFWACEGANIHGPISALLIATGGLMGTRAWKAFEEFWQKKLGMSVEKEQPTSSHDEAPK